MKVVVSIDSFKGSLTSLQAGEAVKKGILEVFPDSEIDILPIADGGEGTVDALCDKKITVNVTGPLGDSICASYGTIDDTAVIEMAEAAGLALVPENKRNPLNTTTFGVGELIKDAINRGFRRFIIGIGGSSTNDCGIGMLTALGFDFKDKNGYKVLPYGKGLENIHSISSENSISELSGCEFKIACDVDNPLCGKNGCSYIYGLQKGADEATVKQMDGWMKSYAEIVKEYFPKADETIAGSGAAGGLGFAFKTFLNGELKSGISLVIEHLKLEQSICNADIVVTGEGRLDSQSIMGKAPVGVAEIAKKYNVPVIAFCGCIGEGAEKCNSYGIDAFFPIIRSVTTLDQALDIDNAKNNLKNTTVQTFRLLKSVKNV